MVKELQSLGLSIRVFDDEGNEVDLKKSLRYDSGVELDGVEENKQLPEEKDFNEESSILVEKGQEF